MTQIIDLPVISFNASTSNDADWRISFAVNMTQAAQPLAAIGVNPIFAGSVIAEGEVVDVPVDLRGITFLLRVWRTLGGHEIMLASQAGEISIGGASFNVFNLLILVGRMERLQLGNWPFDIIATAEGATMQFASGTLTHGADGGSVITSFSSTPRGIA